MRAARVISIDSIEKRRAMVRTPVISRVGAAAGIAGCLFAAWYWMFTGPRDLDLYPDAATSPYRLPWPEGATYLCCQSNRGVVSHRGFEEFAYDFKMPVGSSVCAARAGIVTRVVVNHDGNGFQSPNNLIVIDHGDGTSAWYLHLKMNGSHVVVGQKVAQGERIADSGHVGRSTMPHLHFQVTNEERDLIRVSFSDVKRDRGIPRMGKRYESGNHSPAAARGG